MLLLLNASMHNRAYLAETARHAPQQCRCWARAPPAHRRACCRKFLLAQQNAEVVKQCVIVLASRGWVSPPHERLDVVLVERSAGSRRCFIFNDTSTILSTVPAMLP